MGTSIARDSLQRRDRIWHVIVQAVAYGCVYCRIQGRRVRNSWASLPPWIRDGLTACALLFPLWLLLCAVLLVF